MNPVSARLLGQQLICPQFTSPHDVVKWMGAMQGQEYRMMRWAVAMRTKKPSAKAFKSDFDAGLIISTHLLRTTWQLVAAEDYAWMLSLCRKKALAGRGWMHTNGVDIAASEEERISTIFAETIAGRNDVLKEDLQEALYQRDIRMDEHRLSYHIRLAELSGLLCSGILLPSKRTFALTSERIPNEEIPALEESLYRLAQRYFQSHSPATLEDFVWWSGLNIGDCRRAVESLGDELIQERWERQVFYAHANSRLRGYRNGRIHLLPAYDEYLIGYKSRHIALHPDYRHYAHDNSGTFWNVVLLDGEVVGNWTVKGKEISTTVFKPGLELNRDNFAEDISRWKYYLNH